MMMMTMSGNGCGDHVSYVCVPHFIPVVPHCLHWYNLSLSLSLQYFFRITNQLTMMMMRVIRVRVERERVGDLLVGVA